MEEGWAGGARGVVTYGLGGSGARMVVESAG